VSFFKKNLFERLLLQDLYVDAFFSSLFELLDFLGLLVGDFLIQFYYKFFKKIRTV
jgi:hypothetical protein